jgi:hypothetical protein
LQSITQLRAEKLAMPMPCPGSASRGDVVPRPEARVKLLALDKAKQGRDKRSEPQNRAIIEKAGIVGLRDIDEVGQAKERAVADEVRSRGPAKVPDRVFARLRVMAYARSSRPFVRRAIGTVNVLFERIYKRLLRSLELATGPRWAGHHDRLEFKFKADTTKALKARSTRTL